MKIIIVAVGRLREAYLRAGMDDYLARIGRYVPVEEVEVPAGAGEEGNGEGRRTLAVEGERLQKALSRENFVVCLDRTGKELGSEDFSTWLQTRMGEGLTLVTFVVGGAWGISPVVLSRAQFTLSLSRMTLPHELARLVLAEQLYRALTLWKGEKYHK
ncbi:MAG: 23S rRNA (pseudouridine(1915)-N(3))-methyltransferase RlmH [Calditrichaeota bacterium]|nr:23S rRNA (pseudouridine(1915)-N(3))-methyltransferase RlmH [Calditrichota bacterium]